MSFPHSTVFPDDIGEELRLYELESAHEELSREQLAQLPAPGTDNPQIKCLKQHYGEGDLSNIKNRAFPFMREALNTDPWPGSFNWEIGPDFPEEK